MTYPNHLPRAPITEAVIDFRVVLPKEIDSAILERGADSFGYATKAPLVENTFTFSVNQAGAGLGPSPHTQNLGVRLQSADEKYVALLRLQGFSLSRLAPYQDWETLRGEASRLWSIYVREFRPLKVTRVATRFINKLSLPMADGQDFGDFLNCFGQVPPQLPQATSTFASRLVLEDPETTHKANISAVWRGGLEADGKVPIVLDIDVYSNKEHDPASQRVWETLESLRILKNRCFFGSLTQRAWELYK